MFVVPAMSLWLCFGIIFGPIGQDTETDPLGPVVICAGIFMGSLWFFRNVVFARTDGSRLSFWSYRGSTTIGLSEVSKVIGYSRQGMRYIVLELATKTRLGSRVVVIPPIDNSGQKFWDAYEFLADKADDANHDEPGTDDPRSATKSGYRWMLFAWLAVFAAVVILYLSSN